MSGAEVAVELTDTGCEIRDKDAGCELQDAWSVVCIQFVACGL